jgi:hypothetical protein
MAAFMETLATLENTVSRLAGTYRVALPRLLGAYQEHRLRTNPASDEAAIRTLDMLLLDVMADWRDGEVLLQQVLADETTVDVAADTVGRLEKVLVIKPG